MRILNLRELGRWLALSLPILMILGTWRVAGSEAGQPVLEDTPLLQGTNVLSGTPAAAAEVSSAGDSHLSVSEKIRRESDRRRRDRTFTDRGDIVLPGQNLTLKSNEYADQVVVFGGNVQIDGIVRRDVVCFGGNVILNGQVGGSIVTFGGNVDLGNGAKVGRDIVPIGGNVQRGPASEVGGRVVDQLPFGAWPGGQAVKLASDWLVKCLLLARPMALSLPWLWLVEGALLLVSLLVAVLFPRPVEVCAKRLEQQPVSTFFIGVLTWNLFPILVTLLCIIVVGIIAVPFLAVAFVLALLIGKVALCMFVGRQFGRQLKTTLFDRPLVGFLFGWILITILYVVPVLGGLTFLFVGIWALGAATAATFGGMRRERPPRANGLAAAAAMSPLASTPITTERVDALDQSTALPVLPPQQPPAEASQIPGHLGSPGSSASAAATSAGSGGRGVAADTGTFLPPLVTSGPGVPHADPLLLPRAELWPRVGAAFLDLVIIGFVTSYLRLPWWGHPPFLIVTVAYFAGLIAWKGTTAGGVVLNLKVVRLDGQPLVFAVALVRALAAWLSAAVAFLGFLWILWDPEKQSWHDKIAGTMVVRVPKTQPLL